MSTPTAPTPTEPDTGGPQVRLSIAFNLTASVISNARVSTEAETLADAALAIAEEEPNKAIATLVGAALEMAATGMEDHAWMALQAAAQLVRSVAASQLLGVVQ